MLNKLFYSIIIKILMYNKVLLCLLIINSQFYIILSHDYCKNELNYLCEGYKHVACESSNVRIIIL